MSTGCEIINSNVITLNGGNGAYGGHMISCSFNFGTVSAGGHRANVSLEGKNLGTPRIGESVSITVLGSSFLFDIASYSKSSSATNMTTMSLNCVDISHRILDNIHIILNEENQYTGGNVYKLGKKMLTVPDFVGPYMFPKPTTAWDTATNIFPDLDPLVVPGKTRYGVNKDGLGGETLEGIVQGLIEMPGLTDIGNIPLDFEGTLRNVITNVALQVGIIPVYDLNSNSIKVLPATGDNDGSSFNLAAGIEKLEKIGGKCLVVSASEQEDFTSTEAQGAIGKTEFSPSGNSGGPKGGRDKGGKSTRIRKAYLCNPDFHYSACGKGGQDIKVLPFNNRPTKNGLPTSPKVSNDTLELEQALGCCADPKVWALFVLQCVLNEIDDPVPDVTVKDGVVGEDGQNAVTKWKLSDALNGTPTDFTNTSGGEKANKLVANYYINGEWPCGAGEDKKPDSAGGPVVVGVTIPMDANVQVNADGVDPPNPPAKNPLVQMMLKANSEKWEMDVNKEPFITVGALCGKQVGAQGINLGFMNGAMFLYSVGGFSTILNNDGTLDGDSDFFRNYLNQLVKSKLRYFVLEGRHKQEIKHLHPDGKGGTTTTVTYKLLPTYKGMMLSSEGALGASNYVGPNGYEFKSVNPYRALGRCEIGGLQELAKACYFMYVGNDGGDSCVDDFLEDNSIGKFLEAMRDNKLIEFFRGGGDPEIQEEEEEEKLKEEGKLWLISLMIAPERTVEDPAFSSKTTTCAAGGETESLTKKGAATAMTKMIYNVGADVSGAAAKIFAPAKVPIAAPAAANPNAAELFAFGKGIPEKLIGNSYKLMVIQDSISMAEVVAAISLRETEVLGLTCSKVMRKKSIKISDTVIDVPVTGEYETRCHIRCWYDHEQDPPPVGAGTGGGPPSATNRYVINAHSEIPATWPEVWKTNIQKGFSVSPADFEFEKHRDEEDGSTDYSYEGSEYNSRIVARTKSGLDEIVKANTWVDSIPSSSKTITIIANESLDFGSLPGITDGLQSLDVSMSGGKTTITITVGNTHYKKQMKTMRDANIKALEAGHRSSSLNKQKALENLKAEKIFNL